MEHGLMAVREREERLTLPPGFRFHPTDEELITHYLSRKAADSGFVARAIGEADLNKCEPWDLPWRAKMGEKEWYFFCVKDRKYPTGLRTNRATESGYWKATGKDKEIYKAKNLVGMKKTLVFYRGRAPKGEKTNWVMHEYRLDGKFQSFPKISKNEWVICRVFQKSAAAGGRQSMMGSPVLPPLMDESYTSNNRGYPESSPAHVTCFSNAMEGPQAREESSARPPFYCPKDYPFFDPKLQYSGSSLVQLLESNAYSYGRKPTCSISQETGLTFDVNAEISSDPSASARQFQLHDCFWSY